MKTLYIECKMGAAGDMLSAALLDICENKNEIVDRLNNLGIPKVQFSLKKSEKCGVVGSHLAVKIEGDEEESVDIDVAVRGHDHEHSHTHDHEHSHTHGHEHSHTHDHEHSHAHTHDYGHDHVSTMAEIEAVVETLNLDAVVKEDVLKVYDLIAKAESEVHGVNVTDIHFHEVGKLDAIADIAAACFVMSILKPERIVVSPVHVGSGQVKCAHGILPVPAPATANLLKGIPSYSGDIRGELCTPTGAALIRHFADGFGPQPVMSVEKIGYGMGKKDFPVANCVRVMFGEEVEKADTDSDGTKVYQRKDRRTADEPTDVIAELVCNLDDMTPEAIGFATERLMEEGALDVFTTSVYMKKNRPATMLTVLCRENKKEDMVRRIFRYTTTIGIRENICKRYILNRKEKEIDTPDGKVRVKEVTGYGIKREKKEYEDLAKNARKKDTGI